MKWQQVKPKPKVAAGATAWAVAVLTVIVVESQGWINIPEGQTLAITASIAAVAAWLMPDKPKWKRERP